uniref:ATP synthase complex subunit 8 n=1 Tax=Osteocephalus aff. leoniae DO-2022 TaxID=2951407 RepID=A0A9E8MJ97_9NEOB|nr:ATP synthase F0 subunit 8 [Osteocephalus aff. leoniae DO-2022]
MPQLDSTVWFSILVISWLTLILFSPIKMTVFQILNDPNHKTYMGLDKQWYWPWP